MAIRDNVPVTLTLTAEDARLLDWALGCASHELDQRYAAGDGLAALQQRVRDQLAWQGNPHLRTPIARASREALVALLRRTT